MRAKAMIASLLLLFSFGHSIPAFASDGQPSVSAASSALYESNSGRFLYTKDAGRRRPMASTTKIMTALIALENSSLEEAVTVSADAVGIEGSSLYLREGEKLPMRELLYGLMLASANDAAVAIAIHVAGDVASFSALMNARAEELGLLDTHFTNPHGLHDDAHYTTAHDLALIAAAAMENHDFCEIVRTKQHTVPETNLSAARALMNHNKLLFFSEEAVGIKTGFTKKSGRCLVGAAERDGVRLISVTLNAPDDWDDHGRLFSYGFSTVERRVLAETGALRYSLPVINGEEQRLICLNSEPIDAVLPRSAAEPTLRVHLPHFAAAPVREGEVVGRVEYFLDGKLIASAPLVASVSIPELLYHKGLF